ncbi:histidine kinase [Actinoalloteichus sp. AHMU CJ021]|nr:histidine kinase [Actinoalloteichus sp. AHMU CJ021]
MRTVERTLRDRDLDFDHASPGRFLVRLPGERKQRTSCWLVVGRHGLLVEAFVCRRPDENQAGVHHFLLRRNARLYGVHYTVDEDGDIHLVGRLGAHAVTEDELDRVLGQVLEAADGDFNKLLELGFAGAIRREWAWRRSRGESLANLAAFEHLARDQR